MLSDSDALLRLAIVPGMTPHLAAGLLNAVSKPSEVFSWTMDLLQRVEGISGDLARRICDHRGEELLAKERASCHQAGVRILTRSDSDYPQVLEVLSDPPLAIWMKGTLEPRDRLAIAVVGAQRPTAYGHRQAHQLTLGLARIGATIVSGLGRGIDTIAHTAALEGGSRTIAILGSGFGQIYPKENAELADRIASHGAVISDMPFAQTPSPTSFPRRNRLIAACVLATLVVEASTRSGALSTARLGMELGRTILVVPGNIDNPECTGSNQLIRDGATLVANLEHILQEVDPLLTLAGGAGAVAEAQALSPRASTLTGREKQVYLLLTDEPRTIAELAQVGNLPASSISATVISLELRRLIRRSQEGFVRAT